MIDSDKTVGDIFQNKYQTDATTTSGQFFKNKGQHKGIRNELTEIDSKEFLRRDDYENLQGLHLTSMGS